MFYGNGTVKFYNINNGGEIIGRMTPPVNNLTLSNTILVGNYQASSTITAETNVVVNGTATLKTPGTVYLKPGFTANSGCNLTISIGAVKTDKYYYLKDHLGSIRVVVDTVGEIVSYTDYDPWGMILNGRSSNYGFTNDKYKFTGKERDVETGYDYFGARYYDSRIGRWNVIDPLFEKYPNVSPYNYALNNPLRFIDPNGMEITTFIEEDGSVRNIDDGSNAVFKVQGKGVNKHYQFQGFDLSQASGVVNITTLIQEAQNLNFSNDALNPTESATYCNFATQNIMKSIESTGLGTITITGLANSMQPKLESSAMYSQINYEQAKSNAENGGLSVYSSLGKYHGHVGTFSVGQNIGRGEVANVGAKNGFMNLYRTNSNRNGVYSEKAKIMFFKLIIP